MYGWNNTISSLIFKDAFLFSIVLTVSVTVKPLYPALEWPD